MAALEIDWATAGLGTKPDAQLADELGVSQSAVCRHRRLRKIPAFRKSPKARKTAVSTKDIDWDAVGLGTDYDHIIAERLGIQAQIVRRERAKRDIPSYRSKVLAGQAATA